MPPRKGFTLIELLVVIAIIAILAVVVVLTLNPAQLLAQSRDANRVSDLATLNSAINLYQTDVAGGSLGTSSVISTSLPSVSSTCNLGLPTLPSPYTYHCSTNSNYRNINNTGWIPIDFSAISSGSPFGSLPVDPTNSSSSRLYYTYTTNGAQYELTAPMESSKYQLGGTGDVISSDGAPLATVYAKGTNLTLEPLDYGNANLVGYWPLDEGTGSVAYDHSGNGNNGTWQGTAAGTNGYYSAGYDQSWAGYFDGSTNYMYSANATTGPEVFSIVAWFETTSTSGGKLVGFGNAQTGQSSSYDRHLYMTNQGTLVFGVYPGGARIVTSPSPLNDGKWHCAVATLSGAGQYLYVDGVPVASSSNTGAQAYSGYWRVGYDNLTGWPGTISSLYFNGLIQDVRIYNRALSPGEVQALYNAGR